MNDEQMRAKIDEVLAEVEARVRRRRRLGPVVGTGAAVGLAAVMEACVKVIEPEEKAQPVYGVEVDAAAVDSAADAGAMDMLVVYGIPDAGSEGVGFDAPVYPPYGLDAGEMDMQVVYGIADAGPEAGSDAVGLDQAVNPHYGVAEAGSDASGFDQPIYPPYSVADAGLGEMSVVYGFADAGAEAGSDEAGGVDTFPIPPYSVPPDGGG